MIGLFLGDTDFSDVVLKKIKKLNIKYFIIDLSKNNKFKKDTNSNRISIGKFGEIIRLIKEKKSKKVFSVKLICYICTVTKTFFYIMVRSSRGQDITLSR